MPLAILLLFAVLQSLETAGRDQQDVEGRTEALTNGQLGLERMTRELRQATWLYFRSSAVVDANVPVRTSPTATGTDRLVRFDCSGPTCIRREGAPVTFPPPASPTFATSKPIIGDAGGVGDRNGMLVRHDVFRPMKVDPQTGARTADFAQPDFLLIRAQVAYRDRRQTSGATDDTPLVLEDGISLRNRTGYAG